MLNIDVTCLKQRHIVYIATLSVIREIEIGYAIQKLSTIQTNISMECWFRLSIPNHLIIPFIILDSKSAFHYVCIISCPFTREILQVKNGCPMDALLCVNLRAIYMEPFPSDTHHSIFNTLFSIENFYFTLAYYYWQGAQFFFESFR